MSRPEFGQEKPGIIRQKDLFGNDCTIKIGAKPQKADPGQPSLWENLANPKAAQLPKRKDR